VRGSDEADDPGVGITGVKERDGRADIAPEVKDHGRLGRKLDLVLAIDEDLAEHLHLRRIDHQKPNVPPVLDDINRVRAARPVGQRAGDQQSPDDEETDPGAEHAGEPAQRKCVVRVWRARRGRFLTERVVALRSPGAAR
jgi:hypothetical protein